MQWLWNRKRYGIFDFMMPIFLNILNITISALVVDLFLRVSQIQFSSKYNKLMMGMGDSDQFFAEKQS